MKPDTMTQLRFLGTGTSTGVPAFYCECPACLEAAADPLYTRGGPSVLLRSTIFSDVLETVGAGSEGSGGAVPPPTLKPPHRTPPIPGNGGSAQKSPLPLRSHGEDGTNKITSPSTDFITLIDTAQELRLQLLDAGVRHIDAIIYTHEHNDHVAGLGSLEYYARLKRKQAIPVYAGAAVISYLQSHFDFMVDCLEFHEIRAFEPFELGEVRYTPLPATHNPGCFGFLINPVGTGDTADFRCAYFPDSAHLPAATEAAIRGLEIVIFDATFNGKNWMPSKHMSIDEAVDYLKELDCKQGYLTHLAMSYDTPITAAELERKLERTDGVIRVAHDGLTLALG